MKVSLEGLNGIHLRNQLSAKASVKIGKGLQILFGANSATGCAADIVS